MSMSLPGDQQAALKHQYNKTVKSRGRHSTRKGTEKEKKKKKQKKRGLFHRQWARLVAKMSDRMPRWPSAQVFIMIVCYETICLKTPPMVYSESWSE